MAHFLKNSKGSPNLVTLFLCWKKTLHNPFQVDNKLYYIEWLDRPGKDSMKIHRLAPIPAPPLCYTSWYPLPPFDGDSRRERHPITTKDTSLMTLETRKLLRLLLLLNCIGISVTSKKSPNVYKSCPINDFSRKMKDFTTFTKIA